MTDNDRHRRSSDPRIDELLKFQRIHMSEYHADLSPGEASLYINRFNQMEKGFEELFTTNERVLVILDGKEELNASGEVTRVGGISKDVADLKIAMNGGKLGVKLGDKVLIGLIASAPPFLMFLTTVVRG